MPGARHGRSWEAPAECSGRGPNAGDVALAATAPLNPRRHHGANARRCLLPLAILLIAGAPLLYGLRGWGHHGVPASDQEALVHAYSWCQEARGLLGGLAARIHAHTPFTIVVLLTLAFLAIGRSAIDRVLGMVASWGIGKTPKRFQWTIQRICIRPSFSWAADAWSELVILGWTWHNPPSFHEADGYVLQVDRLTLRLSLTSILRAVRRRGAVEVDMLLLDGVRFKTQRNAQAALNLWEVLQIPDNDVNVTFLMTHAQRHGGMDERAQKEPPTDGSRQQQPTGAASSSRGSWNFWRRRDRGGREVKALPGVATAATRRAIQERVALPSTREVPTPARPHRGADVQHPAGPHASAAACPATAAASSDSAAGADIEQGTCGHADVPRGTEYPIGHPKRRPRWGVPLRFDIRELVLMRMQIWILDMLTADDHGTVEDDAHSMPISTLSISRDRFELNDERRSGNGPDGDGVRGVYLGEIVWTVIAVAWPELVKKAPAALLKTAAVAAVYGIQDGLEASTFAAFQTLRQVKYLGSMLMYGTKRREPGPHVHVHLMKGRGFTRSSGNAKGLKVNVSVAIELQHDPWGESALPASEMDSQAPSAATTPSTSRTTSTCSVLDPPAEAFVEAQLRSYTKTPRWDQHFELGPVRSGSSLLRLRCYHHRSPFRKDFRTASFMGEVVLPISSLIIQDDAIGEDGNLVGWFELSDESGLVKQNFWYTGALKLGLRVTGAEHLPP